MSKFKFDPLSVKNKFKFDPYVRDIDGEVYRFKTEEEMDKSHPMPTQSALMCANCRHSFHADECAVCGCIITVAIPPTSAQSAPTPCKHKWQTEQENWMGGGDSYEVCTECGTVQDQPIPPISGDIKYTPYDEWNVLISIEELNRIKSAITQAREAIESGGTPIQRLAKVRQIFRAALAATNLVKEKKDEGISGISSVNDV